MANIIPGGGHGLVVTVLGFGLEGSRFEPQHWLCPLGPWVRHFTCIASPPPGVMGTWLDSESIGIAQSGGLNWQTDCIRR